MAYDKDQIIEQALEVIDKEECTSIQEILLYLPISSATFYGWELEKLESLKKAIEKQKVRLKKGMRRNWRNSDNPTLQIAEFKLMANSEELEAITISKVKQDVKVESIPTIQYQIITNEDKEVTSE